MTLSQREAVALATAWSTRLAERLGVRVLAIKGPSLAWHGLRTERVSADVDLLIDPRRFDEFTTAVLRAGWHERPLPFIGGQVSGHSVTLIANGWPCDLDLHRAFPGFLSDPESVFDRLWERSTTQDYAHTVVRIPDRQSSMLILALHAARNGPVDWHMHADLGLVVRDGLNDVQRADLADLAEETGCAGSLQTFLMDLEVEARFLETQELREWRARVASQLHGAYPWILLWHATPLRDRPLLAMRGLWPTDDDIVRARPSTERAFWPLVAARMARLVRGARGLPRSLAALRMRDSPKYVTRR